MLNCFLISGVLHGWVLFGPQKPTAAAHQKPLALEVVVKYKRPKRIAPGYKEAVEPRLGSDAFRHTKRRLGDTLASEMYLERLHAHIDPNWHTLVLQAKVQATCSTTLWVDADKIGTVTAVQVIQNDCPAKLRDAAVNTFWRANLLPPPSIFLDKHGGLKLEWTFVLKKDI